MRFPGSFPLAMIFLASATVWASPQKCPTEDTRVPASITGTLEYHPGVYAWYGVHPPEPVCGQKVIQVGFSERAAFRETHRFIGCEVTATGNLFVPDTGYWSTSLGVSDAHIQPGSACKQGDPLPDYSAIPVPSSVRSYKVAATYDPNTFDFSAQVHDAPSGKLLAPWQQYVSDVGNGARDLQRLYCAEGFVASNPKDALGQPDLQANIDPDSPDAIEVAIPNDSTVQMSFVCTRSSSPKDK